MREKPETSEEGKTCHQCNHYHYPLPSVSNAYKHHHIRQIYNGYLITVISIFSIRNNLFLLVPGAEAAGPQAHEDRADELAEGSRVDWIQFLFLTVPQVMVVQGAPGQAHSLRRLVVIQQPLQLKTHTEETVSPSQYILLCDSHLARNEEQQCSLL